MDFEIDVQTREGYHIVTPRGEVDLATSPRLKAALDRLVVAGHVRLVVDLREVSFLDSTGLGALIGGRRRAHAFKGSFSLVFEDGSLSRLFQVTSLDKVFAIHASTEDAVTATRGG